MLSSADLTKPGRLYVWSVIAAGSAVVGGSIYHLYGEPIGNQWFILAALTLISGSATVRLPSTYASISISETFVFTAVLLYGPAAGTVIVALDGLVGSFWISKRHREVHRALFNMSAPAVSAWLSAQLFFTVAGIAPLVKEPSPVNAILPALILFALTYFGINSWLITFVITLEKKLDPVKVWKTSFGWLSLNYFGGASVAFLLVGYTRTISLGYVGVIIPLLLVLYFTFNAAMGRVEDADKHVEQINRLYLSTIETLAMAIDAKDQVTHGHIRRVQAHATSLAKEVGVRDESLLKAIEAAALLHDMGKLAVPEYILNKPGKLTEAEFEKMKLHASVGADILSAIDFPYPVVPIVRHHHENWDGTGYPSGIKATAIPIGARILAVVDCFDALTSDRPYRPRLADEEALQILRARRGTMYDPMVVDTFLRFHSIVGAEAPRQGPPTDVLNTIARSRDVAPGRTRSEVAGDTGSSADEMLTLYELSQALSAQLSLGGVGDAIAKHVRRLVPSSLCVFYLYNRTSDELEAKHVVGDGAARIRGIRMALGKRLSGWVAANRQTMSNADATLDLAAVVTCQTPKLRSCLSTAIVLHDELIAVLALYSSDTNAFNDDHTRIVEAVSRQVGDALRIAAEVEDTSHRDGLTGLPNFRELEQLVDSGAGLAFSGRSDCTLLVVDIVDWREINALYGGQVGDDVVRHVARTCVAGLRRADQLFRTGSDEFIALLKDVGANAAEVIGEQIREAIHATPLRHGGNVSIQLHATLMAVSYPADGETLKALIRTAKDRIQLRLPISTSQPHSS
jgi:diguanylate cyclase (GGDEF)-like protein/putative nucleotidyltransferase with HDIG domain